MTNNELEMIYKKYYQSLFLFAFSLSKNKDDAEDLVANAFVKALLSYKNGNLKAWLYTVLRNEYYNLYKKKKKLLGEEDIEISYIEDSVDVLAEVIHQEEKRWLYEQIYALNQRDKEVMLLSLQKNLDDEEISRILNIKVKHIRVIRNRVKKKLIHLCEKEERL